MNYDDELIMIQICKIECFCCTIKQLYRVKVKKESSVE